MRGWRQAGHIPSLRLRRLRRALPSAFASSTSSRPGEAPFPGPRAATVAAYPRDGKPRGVAPAPSAAALSGPALPPPVTPDSVQSGSDGDDDDGSGGPRESFGRLADGLASGLAGIPEWAARLADRFGLPLSAARTITTGEAGKMRGVLIDALNRLWEVLDSTISLTNPQRAEAVIWTTTSDEHTAKIADLLLRQATRAVGTAVFVRAVVDAYERYEVLGVLGVNSYRSVMHYWLHGGVTFAFWQEALAAAFRGALGTSGGEGE